MSLKFLLPIWQKEKAAGAQAYDFANRLAEEIWCHFTKGPRSNMEDASLERSLGKWPPDGAVIIRFGRALKAACLIAACKSAARRSGQSNKLQAVIHFAIDACAEHDQPTIPFVKRIVAWAGEHRAEFDSSKTPMEELFGHWVVLETLHRKLEFRDKPLALLLGHRICDAVGEWGIESEQQAFFNLAYQNPERPPGQASSKISVRTAAEAGDPKAQLALGIIYFYGRGVPMDLVEAEKWYRRAAEQGIACAQSNLGLMYAQGKGVVRDFSEAEKWFRRAAEQNYAFAQFAIGKLFESGDGVAQDFVEAAKWYLKAAESGLALAQFALAGMYATGRGVLRNDNEMFRLYHLAAEQGHPKAQAALGLEYALGVRITKNTSVAVTWLRKAALHGDPEVQLFLAMTYERGDGIPKDDIEALAWFRISAATGSSVARQHCMEIETRIGGAGLRLADRASERIKQEMNSTRESDAGALA